MRPEADFPVRQWIRVEGLSIYVDGRLADGDGIDAIRTRYPRTADYLGSLNLAVGEDRFSTTDLMPPFKLKNHSDGSRTYIVDGIQLMFQDNYRGKIDIKARTGKKKGPLGIIAETVRLAELQYKHMERNT